MIRNTTIRIIISALLIVPSYSYGDEEEAALDCVIEPSMLVELSSQVRGVLETISVKRGDFVKKGQLVAQLMSGVEKASVRLSKDRAEMEVDIKSRKAQQEFRKNTLEQVENLYYKKHASLREYDDAKTSSIVADFELKKAIELQKLAVLELQRTREVLKLRSIKSTVDGVVVEVMKSPGEYVEEQPVVKIAQIDPLYVEVIVPETLMGRVAVGKEAEVRVETPVANRYIAKVSVVDQVIDASSGTFGVRLELANPDYKIHAGQRCKISLVDDPFVAEDKKIDSLEDRR